MDTSSHQCVVDCHLERVGKGLKMVLFALRRVTDKKCIVILLADLRMCEEEVSEVEVSLARGLPSRIRDF